MENQSRYDPTRKTVGAIYKEAQEKNTEKFVTNGDLTAELQSSLVTDLNETIASNPYDNRPFYITVHEKKDLQMPKMILRRILTSLYRPYPEDDTIVWWVDPNSNKVKFCWCLPHWSEMDNMLANEWLYEPEMIKEIKAWKAIDLHVFGFCKDFEGNWIPNLNYTGDKDLVHNIKPAKILVSM
jgi:hypothetical protein